MAAQLFGQPFLFYIGYGWYYALYFWLFIGGLDL